MDTEGAHDLRVRLGIESEGEVCGANGPDCTYDDLEQAEHDKVDALDRKARAAVLDELELRIGSQLARLERLLVLKGKPENPPRRRRGRRPGRERRDISKRSVNLVTMATATPPSAV